MTMVMEEVQVYSLSIPDKLAVFEKAFFSFQDIDV